MPSSCHGAILAGADRGTASAWRTCRRPLAGGLAQVNVLNSVFIGGCPSSSADAAIDSKVLVPIMTKKGYSLGFSSALTAASASLSPLLPPSIALIIYGVLSNVSIGDLFIGGIVPAALIAILMMAAVYVISRVRGYGSGRGRAGLREVGRAFWRALPALMMPVLLIVWACAPGCSPRPSSAPSRWSTRWPSPSAATAR